MTSLNISATEDQLGAMREKAARILNSIAREEDPKPRSPNDSFHDSWIRGRTQISSEGFGKYPTARCKYFDKNGFLLVKSFSDEVEVKAMKNQMQILVDDEWDPNNEKKKITIFRTDDKQIDNQGSDDYFLESANKVHYFAESRAMDKNGRLKSEFSGNKMLALNKAGRESTIVFLYYAYFAYRMRYGFISFLIPPFSNNLCT